MDDSAFFLLLIFWVIVNSIIGVGIGRRRNNVVEAVVLSIFLGPIGWLIAALTGNLRKCPFCSEEIKPDAKVCRYCGRDLPPPPPAAVQVPHRVPITRSSIGTIWSLVIGAVILVIIAVVTGEFRSQKSSITPHSQFHGTVEATPASPPQVVTLRQSVSLGADTVPAGTTLEFVHGDSETVYVRYEGTEWGIPTSATNTPTPAPRRTTRLR